MERPASRAIDHLVLPTARLDTARRRLSDLGFTVAPEGVHPFGTVNCCVYLSDGTFLEPLALRDGAAATAAIAEGNVFVARDHVFRAVRGEEGFSAVVLASDVRGARALAAASQTLRDAHPAFAARKSASVTAPNRLRASASSFSNAPSTVALAFGANARWPPKPYITGPSTAPRSTPMRGARPSSANVSTASMVRGGVAVCLTRRR